MTLIRGLKNLTTERTVVFGKNAESYRHKVVYKPSLLYVSVQAVVLITFWLVLYGILEIMAAQYVPIDFDILNRILAKMYRWYCAVCIVWMGYTVLKAPFESLTVSDREIIFEFGILTRGMEVVPVSSVASVRVDRNVFQRIFGVGDIRVASPGTCFYEITIQNVPNPKGVGERIRGVAESVRQGAEDELKTINI